MAFRGFEPAGTSDPALHADVEKQHAFVSQLTLEIELDGGREACGGAGGAATGWCGVYLAAISILRGSACTAFGTCRVSTPLP
jgi:hypothetical protein